MRTGVIILCVFAMVWMLLAVNALDAPLWVWIAVAVFSVGFLVWSFRMKLPTDDIRDSKRIGRLVCIWSGAEGAAVFIAVNLLGYFNLSQYIVPAIGAIVGLHFIPLAHGMPRPLYYKTGAAMVVASALAIFLPKPWPAAATGFACAVICWTTSFIMLRSVTRTAQ